MSATSHRLRSGERLDVEVLEPRQGAGTPESTALRDLVLQPQEPWVSESESGYLRRSLRGEIADVASDRYVVGRLDGRLVGNVLVSTAVGNPRIGALAYVITDPAFRGRGIARLLTVRALEELIAHGGRCAHLATGNPVAHELYRACGFADYHGHVMRYLGPGAPPDRESTAAFDHAYFGAAAEESSGLRSVRPGHWGDLAGVGFLYAAPHPWLVKDSAQRIYCHPSIVHERFASILPSMMANVADRGGGLWVLESAAGAVVGAATLSSADRTAQAHAPILDFLVAPAFLSQAGTLIESACAAAFTQPGVARVCAAVAFCDSDKKHALAAAGFSPRARLPGQLRVDGEELDLELLALER
jgi:GNAT superfamily N-acetyltransferase